VKTRFFCFYAEINKEYIYGENSLNATLFGVLKVPKKRVANLLAFDILGIF